MPSPYRGCVAPRFETDLRRQVTSGWEWRIVTFAAGRMIVRARGYAPFRWMARIDAWRCLRKDRALLIYREPGGYSLDDADLR